jgi:hypothetical protein
MTGIVLALAGLACGDGGPGTGAARAPVVVRFEGRWVGTFRSWRLDYPAELTGGELHITERRGGGTGPPAPFALTAESERWVRVRWGKETRLGIYKWERGHVVICFGARNGQRPESFDGFRNFLLTLKPAAPRKP